MNRTQYMPDMVSHPGTTLEELLEASNMSQAELAERTGRPKKLINEIIKGKASITAETALQFESVLGVPASFWNNREAKYQDFIARQEQRRVLGKYVQWIEQFPVKAMAKNGFIEHARNPMDNLQLILRYFGVVSPEQWNDLWLTKQAAFRKSPAFESDWNSITAWLRMGEIKADAVECKPINIPLFKESLVNIRKMTGQYPDQFLPLLQRECANAGVAVVTVPALPETRVSGAAHWVSPRKALIQLSFRYKSNDHFWFTFFHEAAHILLHGKKVLFVDDEDADGVSSVENEADSFSRNFLIPQDKWDGFIAAGGINAFRINQFAKDIDVHPGIVVGRLQREKILDYRLLSGLKLRYEIPSA